MICPQGPDLRRSIGVVPVLAPRFSWCLIDLTGVWGPTYILKGYTMQFPTSDKIILRAAKRLAIFESTDDGAQDDPWCDPKNRKMIDAYNAFLLSCSKGELLRIVALSGVCLDYAYMVLETLYWNEGNSKGAEFPFNDASDLGKDPRQLVLSI